LSIPDDVQAGAYRLDVAFYDPVAEEQLTAIQTATGNELGAWLPLDFVTIGQMQQETTSEFEPAARFGDLADLTGLSIKQAAVIDASDASFSARAGETVTLGLHWLPLQATNVDYTVFAHVIGPDGAMLVQNDRQPQDGFYPTSYWQPNRSLVDSVSLAIPADAPPGKYTIYIGLYELSTGQRLPVVLDGEPIGDALAAATLTVEARVDASLNVQMSLQLIDDTWSVDRASRSKSSRIDRSLYAKP
jgi:hypothetical protein